MRFGLDTLLKGIVVTASGLLLLSGVASARKRKQRRRVARDGRVIPFSVVDEAYHELTGSYEAPHVDKGIVYVTGANLVALGLAAAALKMADVPFEQIPVEGESGWGAFAQGVIREIGDGAEALTFWIEEDDEHMRVWSSAFIGQKFLPQALASAAARVRPTVKG